jgi:lysophospholipase L1-like esterase
MATIPTSTSVTGAMTAVADRLVFSNAALPSSGVTVAASQPDASTSMLYIGGPNMVRSAALPGSQQLSAALAALTVDTLRQRVGVAGVTAPAVELDAGAGRVGAGALVLSTLGASGAAPAGAFTGVAVFAAGASTLGVFARNAAGSTLSGNVYDDTLNPPQNLVLNTVAANVYTTRGAGTVGVGGGGGGGGGADSADFNQLSAAVVALTARVAADETTLASVSTSASGGASVAALSTTTAAAIASLSSVTVPAAIQTRATQDARGFVLYDSSYWSTPTADFNIYNAGGSAALTAINGALRFNGSQAYTNYLTQWAELSRATLPNGAVVSSFTTSLENVDIEMTYRVMSTSQAGNGILLGRHGVGTLNNMNTESWVAFHTSSPFVACLVGNGGSSDYTNYTSNGGGAFPAVPFWAGNRAANNQTVQQYTAYAAINTHDVADVCRLTMSCRGARTTGVFENVTKGTRYEMVYDNPFNSSNFPQPVPLYRVRVCSYGGVVDLLRLRVIARIPTLPKIVWIGDSKTVGFDAEAQRNRFASLLSGAGQAQAVFAGGGNQTNDALNDLPLLAALAPQYAVLCIGRNDVGNGVPFSTLRANYSTLTDTLRSTGTQPVHLLPIPDTNVPLTTTYSADAVSISSFTRWVLSSYAADPYVDVTPFWPWATAATAGTADSRYLNADGTHPTAAGHRVVANAIRLAGVLPAAPLDPFLLPSDDPLAALPQNQAPVNAAAVVTTAFSANFTLPQTAEGTIQLLTATVSGLTVALPGSVNPNARGGTVIIKNMTSSFGFTVSGLAGGSSYALPAGDPVGNTPSGATFIRTSLSTTGAWMVL